ncbi:MAG: N-acetyltransferase, partial [Candidatus Dadabacteria bacterium]|nr:N-acetyltransferase [Candidatus Dadabacteria bacterium]
ITEGDLEKYGWRQKDDNDRIDNLLLYSVCRGAVHFLVTNDKEIHSKARNAQIQEQVHYSYQFLEYLKSQQDSKTSPIAGVEEIYLHEIEVGQPFFDSLRRGYPSYNEWYLKKAQEQRKAWCVRNKDSGEVYAICIYKEEESPVITDNGNPLEGKALKLCTLKVGESVRGRKLGERLLYSAFRNAEDKAIPYVYVHIFGEEYDKLVSLCEDYGFQSCGKYQARDEAYIKRMIPPELPDESTAPIDYALKYYPHYLDGPEVRKFIVPIKPQYHEDLFPDISWFARGLYVSDQTLYNSQSNTIKKAYICHSSTRKIRPGDLLLFYRTHDRKSIECIGVIEQIYSGNDIEKVIPMVSKRTVYSRKEIQEWLKKKTLILLFRLMQTFPAITSQELIKAGITGPIQSIRNITHEQYTEISSGV